MRFSMGAVVFYAIAILQLIVKNANNEAWKSLLFSNEYNLMKNSQP